MMVTQTIDLSMTPAIQVLPEVYASQYDNGIRQVVFNLYTDDTLETPYSVAGLSAIVQGTKPDGNAYAQNATAEGNTVTVTIGTQMVAVEGITPSEIVLRNGVQRIGSINFLLMVEPAGIRDDAVVSDSEIPPYVQSAKEDAEAAAASQAAAASSERAAAASQAAAASSESAAAASQAAAASSERAAAASQAAAASSETNAAASAEASEHWAQQSMEGKTLATLPDVSLPDPIPDESLLIYDATAGKWGRLEPPMSAALGGTGNTDGRVSAGLRSGGTRGRMATTEGNETSAPGNYAHAEGLTSTAQGPAAHAEGRNSSATGLASHAEGSGTSAEGIASHAGGYYAKAYLDSSFVQGYTRYDAAPDAYSKFGGGMPLARLEGFIFGYSPTAHAGREDWDNSHLQNSTTFARNSAQRPGNGISATMERVITATLELTPGAIYLLLCNSFTTETGALYGATARMISCLPTETGTPNILSLGQTTNAPATIAAAANNTITIQNSAATRMTQFTLIRVA